MENILEKLVNNSKKAIDDGIYEIPESLSNSGIDLESVVAKLQHAPLIDKIQIDAAKKIGADYFLLIQSIFDKKMISGMDELIEYGHKKDLKVLVEAHTAKEFENACNTGADIIGINNRNLDTLKIDLNTTKDILEKSNSQKVIISESGIESPDDIRFLHKCGADAYLVGSNIMKTDDIQQAVQNLVNAI